jgi:hypothetical protein
VRDVDVDAVEVDVCVKGRDLGDVDDGWSDALETRGNG